MAPLINRPSFHQCAPPRITEHTFNTLSLLRCRPFSIAKAQLFAGGYVTGCEEAGVWAGKV